VSQVAGAIDLRPEHQDGPPRLVDPVGELPQPGGVRRAAAADTADDRWAERRFVPVVERDRQEHRTGRWLQRHRVCPHEGRRYVLGAGRLVGPLDPGLGQQRRVPVGQVRLQQHHLARLLTGGDDQRRVALVRGNEAAHRVAESSRRVHVDQRRLAGRLCEAVRHGEHGRLLEREYVGEVVGEVLQEGLLGRARIAEYRGQAQLAQQLVCHVVHGALVCHRLSLRIWWPASSLVRWGSRCRCGGPQCSGAEAVARHTAPGQKLER
jgi:hypothetical protein